MSNLEYKTITIASGGTASEAIDLTNKSAVSFIAPATVTGSAFTFQVSDRVDGTYHDLKDSSDAALTYTVTGGDAYSLNPADFVGWAGMKMVSDSTEGGDRDITVGYRQFL